MTEIADAPVPEDIPSLRPNYQGNTNKARGGKQPSREEKKVVEKITTGAVVQRKKSLGKKVKDYFVVENIHNVWSFVLAEVLVPSLKSMISDSLSKGADRALWGESRRNPSSGNRNRVAYESMSGPTVRRPEPRRELSYRARASHEFNEIVLESRGEAEEVLDQLGNLLDDYKLVTVAELYDLVGITGDFTDNKWGWTDLRGAHVSLVRDGYLLNLPRTIPID